MNRITWKETPDKWHITEYNWSYKTKLEKHIINFCYRLMENKGSMSLDEIISKIEQERLEYVAKAKGRTGELFIKKTLAGTVLKNPPVRFYQCVIKSNHRCISLIISEPIP